MNYRKYKLQLFEMGSLLLMWSKLEHFDFVPFVSTAALLDKRTTQMDLQTITTLTRDHYLFERG